jgi:hypothetical protein
MKDRDGIGTFGVRRSFFVSSSIMKKDRVACSKSCGKQIFVKDGMFLVRRRLNEINRASQVHGVLETDH